MLGDYAAPIFARMVMAEKNLKVGPFSLVSQAGQFAWLPSCGSFYTCMSSSSPLSIHYLEYIEFCTCCLECSVKSGILNVGVGCRKWFKGPVFFFFNRPVGNTITDHNEKV